MFHIFGTDCAITSTSVQKLELELSIVVFYSVFLSLCVQSDSDSNRMFYYASLMIC